MTLDFYHLLGSAPCHAVRLTAKALNLDLTLHSVNLEKGEARTPEFLKMNPQHTVPTLKDGDFSIWESRAIMTYLVNQYGKGSSLYPAEPKARAVMEQRLYFDLGALYGRFAEYYYPQLFYKDPADPRKLESLEEGFQFLEGFLDGQKFVAGEQMTLADLSIVSSVTCIKVSDQIDFSKHPNITRWLETMKKSVAGYDEIIVPGQEAMRNWLKRFTK